MAKGILRVLLSIVIITLIFVTSFKVSYKKYNSEALKSKNKTETTKNVSTDENIKISDMTRIVFEVEFEKSKEIRVIYVLDNSEVMKGLDKSAINKIYFNEGYSVRTITPKEVVLLKKTNRYAPNCYYLGIYNDEYLAIFKTNEDGIGVIEDNDKDIKKDFKVSSLKKADVELLLKGSPELQFNSKFEAEEAFLEAYKT